MVATVGPRTLHTNNKTGNYPRWFEDLRKTDTSVAGGKGASLGEMTQAGLPIPPGFVVTASAYHDFLDGAKLREQIN